MCFSFQISSQQSPRPQAPPISQTILPLLLSITYLTVASATNLTGLPFIPRQACDPADQPVKACGTSDLTTSNWAAFNIDDFLSNFIFVFGTGSVSGTSFPTFS